MERQIRTILLDVDNTLVPKGSSIMTSDYIEWIRSLRKVGIEILLCSNNFSTAAKKLAIELEVNALNLAMKPFLFRLNHQIKKHHFEKPMVMMGDQIFTDMIFGYRLKCYRIWVSPISNNDWLSTKILRILENWIVEKPV